MLSFEDSKLYIIYNMAFGIVFYTVFNKSTHAVVYMFNKALEALVLENRNQHYEYEKFLLN